MNIEKGYSDVRVTSMVQRTEWKSSTYKNQFPQIILVMSENVKISYLFAVGFQ